MFTMNILHGWLHLYQIQSEKLSIRLSFRNRQETEIINYGYNNDTNNSSGTFW